MLSTEILLVEDDEEIADFLRRGLEMEGHAVVLAGRGQDALRLAVQRTYPIIILDLMLPDIDGLEVCDRLRAAGVESMILMLTARDGPDSKVEGLRTGADDYLTKPFALEELLARVGSLLRRSRSESRKVAEEPFRREAQRRLAQEMTTLVHGEEATKAVELAAQALFGKAELTELDENTLAGALAETTVAEVPAGEPRTIIDLLVASGLADSKGAARRTVKEGGAYVNNQRIESNEWEPTDEDLLHGSWLVLRRGKKNFAGAKLS